MFVTHCEVWISGLSLPLQIMGRNQCVLTVVTEGALTGALLNILKEDSGQANVIEGTMRVIMLSNSKRVSWITNQTRSEDFPADIKGKTWELYGNIKRQSGNRYTV